MTPEPPHHLDVYGDLSCPYTRAAVPGILELMREHPERLRVEWRDVPLNFELMPGAHSEGIPLALAAVEASEQGRLWEFIEAACAAPGCDLDRLARAVDLEPEALQHSVASGEHEEAVRSCHDKARERGVERTPTFYLDGRKLDTVRAEDVRREVEKALDGRMPSQTR